jgi:hypothetical protein
VQLGLQFFRNTYVSLDLIPLILLRFVLKPSLVLDVSSSEIPSSNFAAFIDLPKPSLVFAISSSELCGIYKSPLLDAIMYGYQQTRRFILDILLRFVPKKTYYSMHVATELRQTLLPLNILIFYGVPCSLFTSGQQAAVLCPK